MQQKPSDLTTNNESTIGKDQTQTETIQGQEHFQAAHLQNPLISQQPAETQNYDHQEVLTNKPEPQSTGNYEHMQEDGHQEYESYQQDQNNFDPNHVNDDETGFDKFNDVDTNQDSNIKATIIQQKVTIVEKKLTKFQSAKLEEEPLKKVESSNATNNFASYQNQAQVEQKPLPVEKKSETVQKNQQSPQKDIKKKKSNKKQSQESQPLPVISADSEEGKKQTQAEKQKQQLQKVESSNGASEPNDSSNDKKPQAQQSMKRQEVEQNRVSEIVEVSEIVDPNSVSAGLIIFEAQRERIGSTLQLFLKYTAKHQKHTTNQKQLITNVEQEIEKKRVSKTPICNALRDYFDDFTSLCKDIYERSYKFVKSDKQMSANPMINMREELKSGIDQLIFLRKATGNEYNRLGEFISVNVSKNVVKLFTDYWKAVGLAQSKHKEKKEELYRKEKQFMKRINKVIKVYTKGKQGYSQQQDLFIEMIKYINQQKDYRTCLIEYGLGLIPLKKAFIKAEQVLYQELQILFNTYKNQFRTLYSIHPKEFIQLEKMQKFIKENNTFEKLSDITDGDYVRSVLITLEKGSVQNLTDKEFEKVLNMLHFEEIIGNSVELLKGTTTKSFELKNKAEQVVDTVSGNLLIFNKETAQMKQKFIIKNIDARITQEGVVEIDEVLKGIIFDSHRTVRITFRDNDRAEQLICFLNQVHENIKQNEEAQNSRK